MLWYEYDEEEHIASEKKLSYSEGKADGKKEGKAEGKAEERQLAILELLEEFGEVPEKVREAILQQQDLDVLRRWHKLAAKAETFGAFEAGMKLV